MLIIVAITILAISGGFIFYKSERKKIINEKLNELAAISSLKVGEIRKWRVEHLRDGNIVRNFIPLNNLIPAYLKDRNQQEAMKSIIRRMKYFIESYDYQSIVLLDPDGKVVLAYPPADTISNSRTILDQVDLENKNIKISDFHFLETSTGIHIDLQIPLVSADSTEVIGIILLRINPEIELFPLIQTWPTPSSSSEILLLRREGDSIVYLNNLKYQNRKALKLSMPLEDTALPASRAALGNEGPFEGVDYRKVNVLSYLRKIPDSPWFMVAKVDKSEIYESLNQDIVFTSIIVFLLVITISGTIIYLWRIQRIYFYKELSSTKDKLFSIISHDLRSPFASIAGFAELLDDALKKNESAKAKEYVHFIQSSSRNAMELLRNLMEWAGLQTNRIEYKPGKVDLVEIVNEVIELMNGTAAQKSIILKKFSPPELLLEADKEMLSTVLRNLISNSIKFSNPGSSVEISVKKRESEILLEVSDNGIGISKEKKDSLFRAGSAFSVPGTNKEKGTGLGLVLVREFIHLHGGKISVSSDIGKFTRFVISLPVKHEKK